MGTVCLTLGTKQKACAQRWQRDGDRIQSNEAQQLALIMQTDLLGKQENGDSEEEEDEEER